MKVMLLKEVPIGKVIEVIELDHNNNVKATGRFYKIERRSNVSFWGKMPYQSREYSLMGTIFCRIITDPIEGL